MMNSTIILRIAVAITLFAHSIPSIVSGGVNDFGNFYLNEIGFAPYGVALAWAIKLSHVVCAILLLLNKYVNAAAFITIAILITGIAILHYEEGWFVVGPGRNGMEFNFLLICVLVSILYQDKMGKAR